ncbi:hypothetical protein GOBAR_DD30599 [Gossypium barbadense]|nr:hypothetical protein GOBAR_DD30599 [Gossypium barbadense]
MRMLEAMSGTRRSLWGLGATCNSIEAMWLVMTVHEGNNNIRLVRDIKSLCERTWEVSFKHVYIEESICGWNGKAATRRWFWIASVQFPSVSTDQHLLA